MTRDKWSMLADKLAGDWKVKKGSTRECYVPAVDTYMRSENGTKLRAYVEPTGRKRLVRL